MKIFINDQFFEKNDAKISVYDHGLLYGDGVFEGIRVYNGRIFKLQEHVDRLFLSAKAIMLNIPMSKDQLIDRIIESVKINNKKDGYIRLVVTRGEGNLGLDPEKCPKSNIIIIVDDLQMYPEDLYKNGINVITASTVRISPNALDLRIKSLNYLNSIMAKLEAKQAGCFECIILNNNGYVVECTADNIFIVKNKRILTPASYLGALDGITKISVIELAKESGYIIEEAVFTKYDIYTADECFLTGTGAEIIPVVKIDGRNIGDGISGEITKILISKFNQLVRI